MRLKKKYRNLLRFIAVTLILILTISVVAAAKQHIDNKKSNHNQDIEEEYPDEDAEAYELPERTLNSDVMVLLMPSVDGMNIRPDGTYVDVIQRRWRHPE